VIAAVAADAAFAPGLAVTEGWWGQTYPPANRWGVWRVEFYDAENNDLGWAFYQPDEGVLYAESYIPASDAQRLAGAEVIEGYLRSLDSPYLTDTFEVWWVEFDPWNDVWNAYLGVDGEGIAFGIAFDEPGNPDSLDNPRIAHVWFTSVLSYEEWRAETEAQAVMLAFNDPTVGERLRQHANWTSDSDPLDDDVWEVRFVVGETVVVRAVVNLASGEVLSVE
jgi:hypothetical protein